MIKSNFELATRCGGVQIKGGSINFDMAGLDTFADALRKQVPDAQRYQYLRSHAHFSFEWFRLTWYLPRFYGSRATPVEILDESIDIAISGKP